MARKLSLKKLASKYIPASGVIIDGKHLHILNPGKARRLNVAQGFYDATGFHPIRSSTDYDPERLEDSTESERITRKRKPKRKAKAKRKGRR